MKMKKHISILLSLVMTLSVLSVLSVWTAIPASAEHGGESFERWLEKIDKIPEDPFTGEYTQFDNPDGSTTYFFHNGSIATKYPDGRQEGVDYDGNQHYMDKDENISVKLPDGTVFTDHADGRKSFAETDGKTTYINPDMSSYETYEHSGIVKEYDSEGHCTGVGFIGSDERIMTDEYGDLLEGSVTGPDGRALTVKDTADGRGIDLTYADGHHLTYQESGIEDSDDGRDEVFTFSGTDEFNGTFIQNTKIDRESDGNAVGKTVDITGSLTDEDGTKLEYNANISYDNDGNPTNSANNVAQITSADGASLWVDKNSQAWEYSDPNNNEKIVVDKDGNALEVKAGGTDFKAEYDENGNVRTADWKTPQGAKLVVTEDGNTTVTLPSGDVYIEDKDGNITKNGEYIRKDGEWVEGYDPKKDTAAPPNTAEAGSNDAEPPDTGEGDTEPRDTEPEETKPADTEPRDTEPEPTLSADTESNDTEPEPTKPVVTLPVYTEPIDTDERDTEEPDTEEQDTEEQDPEKDTEEADEGEGLTAQRVAGSYSASGSSTWIDYDDPSYSGSESTTMTVTFTIVGENSLYMTLDGGEFGPAPYDPVTGKVDFPDPDGFVVHVTFTESGNTINMSMNFDYSYEDGRTYGSFSGSKK